MGGQLVLGFGVSPTGMAKLHCEAHLAGGKRSQKPVENCRVVAKRRRALEEHATEPRPESAGDAQEVRERITDVFQPADVGDPLGAFSVSENDDGVSSLHAETTFSLGMR